VILWMGHDLFHMAANNSVIEYDGVPKMAYFSLAAAMAPLHISAKLGSMIVPGSASLDAAIYLHDDLQRCPEGATWRVQLFDLSGQCLQESSGEVSKGLSKGPTSLSELQWKVPATDERAMIVRCELLAADRLLDRSDYVITQNQSTHPLWPWRELNDTSVSVEVDWQHRVNLRNEGSTAAIGMWPAEAANWVARDPWPMVLLPQETASVRIEAIQGDKIPTYIRLDGLNLSAGKTPPMDGRPQSVVDLQISPLVQNLRSKSRRVVK